MMRHKVLLLRQELLNRRFNFKITFFVKVTILQKTLRFTNTSFLLGSLLNHNVGGHFRIIEFINCFFSIYGSGKVLELCLIRWSFTITVFSPTWVVNNSPSIPIKSPISNNFSWHHCKAFCLHRYKFHLCWACNPVESCNSAKNIRILLDINDLRSPPVYLLQNPVWPW